ncbi:hypothetical protein pb186bvf_017390 [Paramecium bursaria]
MGDHRRESHNRNFHVEFTQFPNVQIPSSKRQIKKINHSEELSISSSLPYLVQNRSDWNQQTFVIRQRYSRKPVQSIDTELKVEFPQHRDFDFVANHALGFQGKENIDLFKFYYRLYQKNKFKIQKIRKEKKQMKEIEQHTQTDVQIKPIPKTTQLKVVKQFITELKQQEKIVSNYVELPKIKPIPNPQPPLVPSVQIVTMTADKIPQAKVYDGSLELEQLMLERVIQAIQQNSNVQKEEIKRVREIIEKRKQQLTDLERDLQLQELIQIKSNIYQRNQPQTTQFDQPMFEPIREDISIIQFQNSNLKKKPTQQSIYEFRFHSYNGEEQVDYDIKQKPIISKQVEESLINEQESTEMQSIIQYRSQTISTENQKDIQFNSDHKQTKKNKQVISSLKTNQEQKDDILMKINEETKLQSSSKQSFHQLQPKLSQQSDRQFTENYMLNKQNTQKSESKKTESKSNPQQHSKKTSKNQSRPEDELIQFEEKKNDYDTSFNNMLSRMIEQKKQTRSGSQISEQGPDPERVNKIADDFVAEFVKQLTMKRSAQNIDESIFMKDISIISQDPQEVHEEQKAIARRVESQHQSDSHLSYERDISHLDKTFKIASLVDLAQEHHLNEDQIKHIMEQMRQKLLQAKLSPQLVQEQLSKVANDFMNNRQEQKVKSEQVKNEPQVQQNLPSDRQRQDGKTNTVAKGTPSESLIQKKQNVDYRKFYEENSSSTERRNKQKTSLTQQSQGSKKQFEKMSDSERRGMFDTHQMKLEQRTNPEDLDDEMKFLQSMINQKREHFNSKSSLPTDRGIGHIKEATVEDEQHVGQKSNRNQNFSITSRKQNQSSRHEQSQFQESSSMPSIQFQGSINSGHQQSNRTQEQESSHRKQSQGKGQSISQLNSNRSNFSPEKKSKLQIEIDEENQQQSDKLYKQSIIMEDGNQQNDNDEHPFVNYTQSLPQVRKDSLDDVNQQGFASMPVLDQQLSNPILLNPQYSNSQLSNPIIDIQLDSAQSPQSALNLQPAKSQEKFNKTPSNLQRPQQNDQLNKSNSKFQRNNLSIDPIKGDVATNRSQIPSNANRQQATNLQNVKLLQFQRGTNNESGQATSSQMQSPVGPGQLQQSQSPTQGRWQATRQQIKSFKGDQASGNSTPANLINRNQKSKLSKFTKEKEKEKDNDDDDEEISEENQSQKKGGKNRKAVQQQQKQKVYDLKIEYDAINKKHWTLQELKEDIESKIKRISNMDDEAKYNVYLYEQRQQQLKNIKSQIEFQIKEKSEQDPKCGEIIRQFHETRMKYKEIVEKDKELKFTDQILLDEEQQTQINTQTHLDDYMKEVQYNIQRMIQQAQLEQLRDNPQQRREYFYYESEILKSLVIQTEVQQEETIFKVYEDDEILSQKFSVKETESQENQKTERMKVLMEKLRQLKRSNPQRFNTMSSNKDYPHYLETQGFGHLLK